MCIEMADSVGRHICMCQATHLEHGHELGQLLLCLLCLLGCVVNCGFVDVGKLLQAADLCGLSLKLRLSICCLLLKLSQLLLSNSQGCLWHRCKEYIAVTLLGSPV